MDFDIQVKLAIYHAFAASGRPPHLVEIEAGLGAPRADILGAYVRLAQSRLLVLEPDGHTIRMAPPFSGVPTQHRVQSDGVEYFANCAWDALGVPAALQRPALVTSLCGQSREPLQLRVSPTGPEPSAWLFHCAVPAARWWQDIGFT